MGGKSGVGGAIDYATFGGYSATTGGAESWMGGKSAPKAPDMSGMVDASKQQSRLQYKTSQEQLSWAREQWGDQKALMDKVVGQQMDQSKEQWGNAQKDRARYEDTFQPIEDKLVKEFEEYDSPERRAMESGRAQAGVQTAMDAQRENSQANLEAYGIDPSQTRSQALDSGARIKAAAQQASSGNQASDRVANMGRALRAESINIGKGLPGQSMQAYMGANQAGNSALNNMNSTIGSGNSTMGSAQGWGQMGGQSLGQAGGFMNQQFQNQLSSYDSGGGALGQWGQVAGMGMGAAAAAGYEEGGVIPPPGEAPPPGQQPQPPGPTDTVPTMLAPGEYVVDADTVKFFGTKHLDGLKEKRMKSQEQQQGAIPGQGAA